MRGDVEEGKPRTQLAERGVTRRETEVLAALAERLTNAEIAGRLYLSERTIESHVSALLRKLRAPNRLVLGQMAKELLAEASVAPFPAALELLADPSSYVGRADELARLKALWARAADGRMLFGVVAGEAGIGKSRLVAEVAADVHRTGARVALGSCFEDVELPYQPFVQILADDMSRVTRDEIRRRVGPAARALTRIVPEIADHLTIQTADDVIDVDGAQAEVINGLHGYLLRAAESGPMLFVVEDVHWATATTLNALRRLARVGGHRPLLVLVTTRDVAPDVHEALNVFLSDLRRLPTTEFIELSGLMTDDVAALLDVLGASEDPAVVTAETKGNPLFVREVAHSAGGRTGSLPALLMRRYALLDDPDLVVLDIASVVGSHFDAGLVASALGKPTSAVLESLERAEMAGLVAAAPDNPARFSFVHALFRNARYDAIASGRRLELHRAVADALEPRASNERVLSELARHACIAAPLGEPRAALAHAIAAAELAERSLALEEAAVHYGRALDVADLLDPPDPKLCLGLEIRLGEALRGAADPHASEVLLRAAMKARSMGDTQALAEVSWAMVRYGGPPAPSDPEFLAITEEVLAALGPDEAAVRARTLAVLSEALYFTEPTRASELAHEARAIAVKLGDPVTLGHVLISYRISAHTPENADARHPTADQLIGVGRRTGHTTFALYGLAHRAWSFREEGDVAAANETMDSAVSLHGDHAVPPAYAPYIILFRSAQKAMAGDLDGAEETANEVLGLASDILDPTNLYGPALLMIRHNQARLAELIPLVEVAATQEGLSAIYQAALSVAYASGRRLDEAHAILRRFADDRFAAVPRNMVWLGAMVCFAEVAEATADRQAGAELSKQLGPFRGRIADVPQAVVAPVDLALAQAAMAAGAHEKAESHAARAVAASRSRNTPIFLGRELIRLAAARRELGIADGTVERLVDEALAICERTGALLIRRDAERYGLAP